MSRSRQLTIEILTYWHAGSGSGRGGDVDALVLKDRHGLPYLPGKTVKGLLREAMWNCEEVGQVAEHRTDALFGKAAPEGRSDGSTPGVLVFDDFTLPDAEHAWLAAKVNAPVREALYERFASTKLNEQGMADDRTLRATELCVPLTLTAIITGPDNDEWVEDVRNACVLVRALGSHRQRGLGRCRVSLR